MNRAEHERVERLIELWLSYHDKAGHQTRIALSGPTQEQKMMEFHGDFPQPSNVKPDILASKAEQMRRYDYTKDEIRAHVLIGSINARFRDILIKFHEKRRKHNPETQKPWTHADVARLLNLKLDRYHTLRNAVKEALIDADNSQAKTVHPQLILHAIEQGF